MRNSHAHEFKQAAHRALNDPALRDALRKARGGFVDKRRQAVDALPEFEAIRDHAKQVKEHTLQHLDYYLELFERNAKEAGAVVHWARTGDEANRIVAQISLSDLLIINQSLIHWSMISIRNVLSAVASESNSKTVTLPFSKKLSGVIPSSVSKISPISRKVSDSNGLSAVAYQFFSLDDLVVLYEFAT